MADSRVRSRKFNDEEVALIIKRAAELQQTEQAADEPGNAMTLAEVEQIATEAGIDPRLIRRAAQGLDRPSESTRPSPWVGAPTKISFERVVDGEISNDDFEPLVNEMRRALGDNGIPSVLGRTLAWTSTQGRARRNSRGRQIDVSVTSRGGVTTIRVEEELRNVAGALFGGLVGGGAGGTSGISMAIGIGVLHSAPLAGLIWIGAAGGFYTLARTIFGSISGKRERQLRDLARRLEEQVTDIIAARQSATQISAGASAQALTTGESAAGTA